MGAEEPVHVVVRDARPGRDHALETAAGGEVLFEFDRAYGLPYVGGDSINSPNGKRFLVISCHTSENGGRMLWEVAVTHER